MFLGHTKTGKVLSLYCTKDGMTLLISFKLLL